MATDLDIVTTSSKTNAQTSNSKAAEPKYYPRTAFAYIAQLEHEYLSRHKLTVCNHCLALAINSPQPLKQCVGCRLVDYCGRDCQRGDWKRHKGVCWMVQGKGDKRGWLEAVWKGKEGNVGVYRRVIDAYRLRMVTDHKSREEGHGLFWEEGKDGEGNDKKKTRGLVWAQGDVLADFQRWLDLCEESGALPEWWAWEDRMECLLLGIDRGGQNKEEEEEEEDMDGAKAETGDGEDESVYAIINQDSLIQRYDNDTSIRNALGIFAELVVGYDGKGRATDNKWYLQFQEFMDLHPQERLRLIQGTIDAIEGVKGEHAELLAGKKEDAPSA